MDLYTNYYRCRRDYPAIFEEFTPQSVERIFATGILSVLDHPALDGAKVRERERGKERGERERGVERKERGGRGAGEKGWRILIM